MENELEQLLDSYYKARTISKDDQRSLAGGVAEMTLAEMALEQYIDKAFNAGIEAALLALPEKRELDPTRLIHKTDAARFSKEGWNAYADQARQAIEGLKR